MQNVLNRLPITSDDNVAFNFLCGLKIRNITKGTEAITTSYDSSLISQDVLTSIWVDGQCQDNSSCDLHLLLFKKAGP